MTEELVFERILKDRKRYIRYNISHDKKSFLLVTRYTTGNYLEYKIHVKIMVNADTMTSEVLDKIEKESVKLFKKAYDFLDFRKTYQLIAIILLLLVKYKIIKLKHLAVSKTVKISYYVITKENARKTYNLKPDDFLNLIKKLDKFFKENKVYKETE